MRKKLKETKKKLTCSINPILFNKLIETHENVSKHIERLVYEDMRKNNLIDEIYL